MKRTSRKASKLSELLQRHLNAYALAASAAGVGVLAFALPAEGRIVYTRTHQQIGYIPYQIDLNHDGITDFAIETGYSSGPSFGTVDVLASGWGRGNRNHIAGVRGKHKSLALALKQGDSVGPKRFLSTGPFLVWEAFGSHTSTNISSGQWINVKKRYLALSFQIDGKTHYGWARLNVKVNKFYPPFDAVLTGYAYETIPNKPIIAGKTKGPDVITLEPGSLGQLAQGSAGRSVK